MVVNTAAGPWFFFKRMLVLPCKPKLPFNLSQTLSTVFFHALHHRMKFYGGFFPSYYSLQTSFSVLADTFYMFCRVLALFSKQLQQSERDFVKNYRCWKIVWFNFILKFHEAVQIEFRIKELTFGNYGAFVGRMWILNLMQHYALKL